MSEEIKSPTFPESVADGTIANWVKKEGEAVSQDEVIAEIETDKVVLEVLAPSDGKISKIHKNEGDTVLSAELIGEFISGDSEELKTQTVEEEKSKAAMERMLEGTFTLDDFLDQVQQIRKMGPISNVMGMLPGMTQPGQKIDSEAEERRMNRLEGIIQSMTSLEKAKPEIIDGSRRARIANGSGTQPSEVSQLIKQFREMKKMMKKVPKNSKSNKNKKKKKGGRTSPKGSISPVKKGLSLPGLGQDSVKESLKNLDLSDFDFS